MMTLLKSKWFVAALLWTVLVWPDNCSSQNYNYQVKVDASLKQLSVVSCFVNSPAYLYSTNSNAETITKEIIWKTDTSEKKLYQKAGYIDIPRNQKGCLSYLVKTRLLRDRLNSSRFHQEHPEDFILSIGSWLWKPARFNRSTKITVDFIHSEGIQVSAPWKLVKKSTLHTSYLMNHTPDDWPGFVAFGRFEIETIKVAKSLLQLALINGKNSFDKAVIIDWLNKMTHSVASITGTFPVKETQVLIIFQKGSRGVVPWGQVNRGGLPGVLFIVNPDGSKQELMQDWTAAHEFSHLLIPYTPEDRWFSEGFASYYQNISRVRMGLLEEKLAWEKLIAGFQRGNNAAQSRNAPLLKRANGSSLMQMYWGGAVIALKAEIELFKKYSGKMTLSDVMKELNDCCLHSRRSWSAKQVFHRMDEITATKIFSQLYNTEVMQKKYPDLKSILNQLGITRSYYGELIFDESQDKVNLRDIIING